MKSPVEMDTVQIEITNACDKSCSNCTRFCGHHRKPYMMSVEYFKVAIDSMLKFPQMVGVMGGEPLLHPHFAEICEIARKHFPKEQLGLWTGFPKGYEHHREVICETFGNIFLNDHSMTNIYHQPFLVSAREIVADEMEMFFLIDKCWVQNSWSASINPYGAYFCEVAAAWAMLLEDRSDAWKLEKGWWWRIPKDFREQVERFCPMCGGAMPLRRRPSTDVVDDISPGNYKILRDKSRKIKAGFYEIHPCTAIPFGQQEQMAAYKDERFRNQIARSYGIFLVINEKGFQTPYLSDEIKVREKSIFEEYKEDYEAVGH